MATWWEDGTELVVADLNKPKGYTEPETASPLVTDWPEFARAQERKNEPQWWEQGTDEIGGVEEVGKKVLPELAESAAKSWGITAARGSVIGNTWKAGPLGPMVSDDQQSDNDTFNTVTKYAPEVDKENAARLSIKLGNMQRLAAMLHGDFEVVERSADNPNEVTVQHKFRNDSPGAGERALQTFKRPLLEMSGDDRQLFLRVMQDYAHFRAGTDSQYNPLLPDRSLGAKASERLQRGQQGVGLSIVSAAANLMGGKASDDTLFLNQIEGIRKSYDPATSSNWIAKGVLAATEMVPPLAASVVTGTATKAAASSVGLTGTAATIAGGTGPAAFWYAQTQPSLYADLVTDGIDKEVASKVSVVASIPIALVEQMQVSGLKPNVAKDEASKLVAKSIKEWLAQSAKSGAKTYAEEFGEEFAQSAMEVAAKATADYLDANAPNRNWRDELMSQGESLGEAALALPFLIGPGASIDAAANYKAMRDARKGNQGDQSPASPGPNNPPTTLAGGDKLAGVREKTADELNKFVDEWTARNLEAARGLVAKLNAGEKISRKAWRDANPEDALPNGLDGAGRMAQVERMRSLLTEPATAAAATDTAASESQPTQDRTASPQQGSAQLGPTAQGTEEPTAPAKMNYRTYDKFGKAGRRVIDKLASDAGIDLDSGDGETLIQYGAEFYGAGRRKEPMPPARIHPQDAKLFYDAGRKDALKKTPVTSTSTNANIKPLISPQGDQTSVPLSSQEGQSDGQEETNAQGQAQAQRQALLGSNQGEPAPGSTPGAGELRKGEIGMMLSDGEQVKTSSGRVTSPFPKLGFKTPGKTNATIKRVEGWLRQEAIDEAKSRGDDYNSRIFENTKPGNLSPADKDSFEQYLFGEQPSVQKPSTKSLTGPGRVSELLRDRILSDQDVINALQNSDKDAAMATIKKVAKREHGVMVKQVVTDGRPTEDQRRYLNQWDADMFSGMVYQSAEKRGMVGSPKPAPSPKPEPPAASARPAIASLDDLGDDFAAQAKAEIAAKHGGGEAATKAQPPIESAAPAAMSTPKPATTQATKPEVTAPPTQAEQDQAEIDRLEAEVAAKAKKLADKFRTKAQSTGLDPELISDTVDLTVNVVKLLAKKGQVKFREYVRKMSEYFDSAVMQRAAPYMRDAWDIIRERVPSAKLEESRDVLPVLEEITREADQRTESTGPGKDQNGERSEPAGGQAPESVAQDSAEVPAGTGKAGDTSVRDSGNEQRPGGAGVVVPADRGDTGTGDGTSGSRPDQSARPATGVGTDPEGSTGPTIDSQRPSGRDTGRNNYRLTAADSIESGGTATKFDRNLAAIRLLDQIESENRLATVEEQAVLAKFTGWGQHGRMFLKDEQLRKLGVYDPKNLDEFQNLDSFDSEAVADILEAQARENARRKGRDFNESRLSAIRSQANRVYQLVSSLSPREYQKARRSARNSHYTSPEVARSMWSWISAAVANKQGALRVLEPSEGSGIFWGTMPEEIAGRVEAQGIDPDEVSHRIARQLYQNVRHSNRKFEEVAMPDNYYDVIVSNVPFAPSSVLDPYDKDLNKAKASVHNYFFMKAAKKVRDGGIVAFITSHYTMDAVDTKIREKINSLGLNFLGAVRLNNEAFGDIADTEVTTDIIFLQKGKIDAKLASNWLGTIKSNLPTRKAEDGRADFPVNEYFLSRKGARNIVGRMTGNGTMRSGEPEFTVEPDGRSIAEALPGMLQSIPVDGSAFERGVVASESEMATVTDEIDVPDALRDVAVGAVVLDGGSLGVRQKDSIKIVRKNLGAATQARVKSWIDVKDAVLRLKAAQVDPDASDSAIESLRADLNKAYDSFVKKYDPVLKQYNRSLFSIDWNAPDVWALEEYDQATDTAKKADIFRERTQFPPSPPKSAESPKDALIISVQQKGGFDQNYIADLLGIAPDQVIDRMGDMLLKNPEGGYELREIYLSGNVRRKLAIAKQAAESDPSYQRNVEALTEVIPADLPPGQILVRIGAPWVPGDVYAGFLSDILGVRDADVRHVDTDTGGWSIDFGRSSGLGSQTNVQEYGTPNLSGHEIFEQLINSREVKVTLRDRDGNVNVEASETATKQAQERATKIKSEFTNWIWGDAGQTDRLVRIYNDIHRSHVDAKIPSWAVSTEGLSELWAGKVRDYQLSGAGRVAYIGNTLLAYVVGAGKTLTATIGIMNARRIGNWRKTVAVVPNHLVQQWAGEVKQYYPQAKVLAATEDDFSAGRRQTLFARIGTGNYDLIVIPESSFKRMPLSASYMESYFAEQLMEFEQMIEQERAEKGASAPSVKELEEQMENFENRMRKLLNAAEKDPGPFFDELGIDSLVVDEAHNFKNLFFRTRRSRTPGINPTGNQKTFDMLMKTDFINQASNERGVMFLTGTPIANTMGEAWVMQRYLQPGLLKQNGAFAFDDWASTFGEVETTARVDPIGRKFRMETRFNQFINLPELRRMWGQFADIKMLKDINLPRPPLLAGKPHTEVVKSGPLVSDYMFGLARRAGDMPDDPRIDNILKVMSDGLKAAVDIRMLDPNATPLPTSKLNRVSESVAKVYHATSEFKGTQIVWLDSGTPKKEKALTPEMVEVGKWLIERLRQGDSVPVGELREKWDTLHSQKDKAKRFRSWLDMIAEESRFETGDEQDEEAVNIGGKEGDDGDPPHWIVAIDAADDSIIEAKPPKWNAYQEIKNQLVSQGVKADEVVFIHDIDTPEKRLKAFAAMNNGQIRVIIASTRKLGTGANIQRRLSAVHHVDAPWRPADLEQRDGRILRPGNEVLSLAREAGVDLMGLLNNDPSWGGSPNDYLDSLSQYQRSQVGESLGVLIKRYVTDGSIDARYWQTLEDKARMLEQFYGADESVRSTDDVSATSMDYAEVKAAAAKDPRFVEKVRTEARVRDLESSQRAFFDDQHTVRSKLENANRNVTAYERSVERDTRELADLRGKLASAPEGTYVDLEIDGVKLSKMAEIGDAIVRKLSEIGKNLPVMQIASDQKTEFNRKYVGAKSGPVRIGTVYGRPLFVDVTAGWRNAKSEETRAGNDMNMDMIRLLAKEAQDEWEWSFAGASFGFGMAKGTVKPQLEMAGNFEGSPTGNAMRLKNQFDPRDLERSIENDTRSLKKLREDDIPKLQSLLTDRWPKQRELEDARFRLRQLNEELGGDAGDVLIKGWVMSDELYNQLGGDRGEAAIFMRNMTGNVGNMIGTVKMPSGEVFEVWTGRNHLAPGGEGQYPPRPGMVWVAPKDSIDGSWEKMGEDMTLGGQKIEPPAKPEPQSATENDFSGFAEGEDGDTDLEAYDEDDGDGDPGYPEGQRINAGAPAAPNPIAGLVNPVPAAPSAATQYPAVSTKPISIVEVMKAITGATKAFGKDIPFRTGYMGTSKARGFFRVFEEVVRIRRANNISTAAHELGHAIEKIVYGWPKGGPWKKSLVTNAMQSELLKLGRALYGLSKPAAGYKREGFAEFTRLYLHNPAEAKNQAPNFYDWFESTFLAASPKGAEQLRVAQQKIAQYNLADPVGRQKANIVDPTTLSAQVAKFLGKLRKAFSLTGIFEEYLPLRGVEQAAAEAVKEQSGRDLDIREQPYTLAKRFRGTASAIVKHLVEIGGLTFAGNKTSTRPLGDIAKLVPSRQRSDFTVLLWALRAKALLEDPHVARDPGPMTLQDADQIIADLGTPKMMAAADIWYQFNDGVLDYVAGASPTFRLAVDAIRARDPGFYIPLQREFAELEKIYQGQGGANAASGDIVKRLKGSGRRILDPIQSALTQAERMVEAAHERVVIEAMVAMENIEGMGGHIEEVEASRVPVAQRDLGDMVDEIAKRLRDKSVELYDQNGQPIDPKDYVGEVMTLFGLAGRPKGGEPIMPVYDRVSGKVRWLWLNPDVYEALLPHADQLSPAMRLFLSLATFPLKLSATALRLGATGLNPAFALITNTFMDLSSLGHNTQATDSYIEAVWAGMKALPVAFADALTGGRISSQAIRAYRRLGLEFSQSLTAQSPFTRRVSRRIFHGPVRKMLSASDWYDWISGLLQFTNTAARAAEMQMLAKKYGIDLDNMSLAESVFIATAGKEVTTDFSATGSYAKIITPYIPFARSGLQGPRAALRALRRDPLGYFIRASQIAWISAALWMWNKDEEWWKDLDENDKLRYLNIPVTIGDRNELLQVPVNQDADRVFGTGLMAVLDSAYGQDQEATTKWVSEFLKSANPVANPPIIEEAIDQWNNRDSYFNKPIVPGGISRRPTTEQYTEYTSEFAKKVGEASEALPSRYQISPVRLDHAIRGLTGAVGAFATRAIGIAMTGNISGSNREPEMSDSLLYGRLFKRGGRTGTSPESVDTLYRELEAAQQRQNSIKTKETPAERQRRLMLTDTAETLKIMRKISSKTPGVDDRRYMTEQQSEVARMSLEIAKAGDKIDRMPAKAARKFFEYFWDERYGDPKEARKKLDGLKKSAITPPPTKNRTAESMADWRLERDSAREALRQIKEQKEREKK